VCKCVNLDLSACSMVLLVSGVEQEVGIARRCGQVSFFLELVLSSLRTGEMRFPTGDVIVGMGSNRLSLLSRSTEWWVVKGFSYDLGLVLDPTEYSRKE
jgi:hypothetical protein